jgi:DNA-binding beta-propeller fold protein YncE
MDRVTRLRRRGFALALSSIVALLAACAEAPVGPAQPIEIPVFPPAPETPRFFWERTLYGSADVVPDDDEGRLRRLLTGEVRTGEGLSKPYGIAAHRGRIYVSDTVDRGVLMFDLAQRRFKRIGVEGAGALRMPFGLETDGDGNLYVVDGALRRVLVYDAEGNHLRTLGADLKFSRPAGIAIDRARRRIYVVDVGGVESEEHRVRAIDLDSGRSLFDIGKRGEGPGEFNLPRDAVVGRDGELYVVDGGNFRVQVFDSEGKFVKTFGAIGRQTGQFSRPKEIAIDGTGNVYVVDTAFGNFQIFDREGRLLLDVGTRGNTDAPARFMLPSGIAVDVDGRVYMVDQFFRKIDVFRPADVPAGAAYGQARSAAK